MSKYFFVKHHESSFGHRVTLQMYTDHLGTEKVDKTYPSSSKGVSDVLYSKKGQWGGTLEESINHLYQEGEREVKRISKKVDLKPSQVRRLELLNQFLGYDSTLLCRGE